MYERPRSANLIISLLGLCFLCASCGGSFFIGFVSNPVGTQSISGTVSTVTFGFIQDVTGTRIDFTGVTFVNPGTITTINFCGDQRSKFRINSSVQATFSIGLFCSNLISIATKPEG